MDRTPPSANSDEIELYIRTIYSLLRSSGPIRVRSLEETHIAMRSNLHYLADSPELDVSALVYSALRLPDQIIDSHLVVMGQMEDVFAREGYRIDTWKPVKARARRRKYFFDSAAGTMAAFVASVSDIDDLIPCMTTFQIEWNKIHQMLNNGQLNERLMHHKDHDPAHSVELLNAITDALGLSPGDMGKLGQLWPGSKLVAHLQKAVRHRMDLRLIVLGSGLGDYRRSVQYWWGKVEEAVADANLFERPIYFVSSNIHSIVNLITGLTTELKDDIVAYVEQENPEDLLSEYQALPTNENGLLDNFLYYASRLHVSGAHNRTELEALVERRECEAGITRVSDPHCIDVEAQIIELNRLDRNRVDPRLRNLSDAEWDMLSQSNAILLNIDYPLGMAAYHVFSQISTAVGRILGVYILGKAATLNGRVGDVMIPNVVYDEHSRNTFLFRNCFTAQDVGGLLNFGTVFDNQKAVTVRGTILQNRDFMHVFYEEGYTDIEMEAGPYLSGIYEDVYPQRYPTNEIVNLFINVPYDIGVIHYASDTPISRRQTLLSKSLSYFGVDATYATSIAVLRRILAQETAHGEACAWGESIVVAGTPMTSVDIFVQHYADAAAMPEQLALDIARIVYPGANTGYYEEQIDGLGAEMGKVLEGRNPGRGLIQGFLQAFNRDLGFRGNKDDYYDPCNSLLPDVIARKTGLPIMLCVLCMAIGPRVYMRMEGLGFPHHFLVIYHDGPEAWVLDPFHGVVVEPNGTEDHLSKVLGRAVRLPAQMWEPVTPHAIAARILNNLHHAYLLAQNLPMVAHVLDYLIAVNPTEQQYWHERGLIHYREQRWEEAQRDLRRYLALAGVYPLPATERRPLVPTSGQAATLSQETTRIVELYHDAAEKLARSN